MSDFALHQNLSQQQTLAPQMRKSLEILQVGTLELSQLVRQALEANPVLEDASESISLDADTPDPETADSLDHLNETDDDWRDDEIVSGRLSSWSEDDEASRQHRYESIVAPETLQSHLQRQLRHALVEPQLRQDAMIILGNLDERGFLDLPPREISTRHGLSAARLAAALALVRSFDPPGVGAADLTESLLLQLERSGCGDLLAARIVRDHLPDLARRQHARIARALGVSEESVVDALGIISRLSPNPGAAFEPAGNPFVAPDVVIERGEDGAWIAQLTAEGLPSLRINDAYKDMLGSARTDPATRQFLRERINDGRGLIRAIEQRQETILAIAHKIIERQGPFLDRGPRHLRPLTMTGVAEELGMHNATVSRAVAGKFVLTPHGLLEMRAFFASGYQTTDGEGLSNSAVREAIQKLVQGENRAKPLSDDALTKALAAQGITVARRTVAKYREQIGILPFNLRRER